MRTDSVMLLAALVCAGCGGPPLKVVPWNDSMSSLFANTSVEPNEPPRELWTTADEEVLQRRLGFADCVAVGRTKLVSVYTTHASMRQIAISFRPLSVIHGSLDGALDKDGDLLLQLTPSEEDFQKAVQLQQKVITRRYLAFLKRRPRGGGGGTVWVWALYRDDARLIDEVRVAYEALKAQRERDARR